jgi:hypothetical protein
VTGPSSNPRGERGGTVPVTWQATVARTEQHVDDDAPDPTPNRATRRALKRAARRAPAQHDDGPSIAECAADDRLWPLQKHGE